MSKPPSGPPDNRGPDSPGQQRADLERLKYMMEQLPDQSYPINPPPIMDPKVITFPTPTPPGVGRYLVASDGDWLAIVDTVYGHVFAHSAQRYQAQVEELLRLANRPEQENRT
jgi:hypothetical protein